MKVNKLPKSSNISEDDFLIFDSGNSTKTASFRDTIEFLKDKFSGGGGVPSSEKN